MDSRDINAQFVKARLINNEKANNYLFRTLDIVLSVARQTIGT